VLPLAPHVVVGRLVVTRVVPPREQSPIFTVALHDRVNRLVNMLLYESRIRLAFDDMRINAPQYTILSMPLDRGRPLPLDEVRHAPWYGSLYLKLSRPRTMTLPLATEHSLLTTLSRLSELLPPAYAHFRPLLADALLFFLDRLSPRRQQEIFATQLALPVNTSRSRRRLALFRLCPTLHKLGQVVAHDRRLSGDLRRRLQELDILDWALTTTLSKRQCEAVVQLALGALTLNDRRVRTAIAGLGHVIDDEQVQAAVGQAIGQVRSGRFPGFDWMTSLLDALAATSAVRFREEVSLFRKALLTLAGVAADVSPDMALDGVLVREGASQFIASLWWRPWLWPDLRPRGGAHLSNADLFGLGAELPASALRFWAGSRI